MVRGIVKKELRKYMTSGELVGRQGKNYVSIPIRQIEIPNFRHETRKFGGVGQGEGDPGTPIGQAEGDGQGAAGDGAGEHILEVDVTLDELAQIMAEELELPNIQPRARDVIEAEHGRFSGIHRSGPESLRHFRRTFREALKRQIASGAYNFNNPVIVPIKDDKRYRARRIIRAPETNAAVIYVMDVSGSMGDEQKDIVRNESFWINTWLQPPVQGSRDPFRGPRRRGTRGGRTDLLSHPRERWHAHIVGLPAGAPDLIDEQCPPSEWNVYVFHFSDGDNWGGGDTQMCVEDPGRARCCPRSTCSATDRWRAPMAAGRSSTISSGTFKEIDNVVLSEIGSKDEIYDSIKKFLGKGR